MGRETSWQYLDWGTRPAQITTWRREENGHESSQQILFWEERERGDRVQFPLPLSVHRASKYAPSLPSICRHIEGPQSRVWIQLLNTEMPHALHSFWSMATLFIVCKFPYFAIEQTVADLSAGFLKNRRRYTVYGESCNVFSPRPNAQRAVKMGPRRRWLLDNAV